MLSGLKSGSQFDLEVRKGNEAMRVLALETSERIGTIALLEVIDGETQTLRSARLPEDCRSARSLLPELKKLLSEQGWNAEQLELIAVTTGPGSFTGLRIGVTMAKSLAYATGAKLVGVPTLLAIAAGMPDVEARRWAIVDAQRQELFSASFAAGFDANEDPEVKLVSNIQWLEQLEAGDVVAGSPLKKLATKLPSGVVTASEEYWAPQAEVVGRLGVLRMQAGKLCEPMQLVPEYFRKSAAEEKAEVDG